MFMIRTISEPHLYWGRIDCGEPRWGNRPQAIRYDEYERNRTTLPVDGEWVSPPETQLDMLEELLALTEWPVEHMDRCNRDEWKRLSAKVAILREEDQKARKKGKR